MSPHFPYRSLFIGTRVTPTVFCVTRGDDKTVISLGKKQTFRVWLGYTVCATDGVSRHDILCVWCVDASLFFTTRNCQSLLILPSPTATRALLYLSGGKTDGICPTTSQGLGNPYRSERDSCRTQYIVCYIQVLRPIVSVCEAALVFIIALAGPSQCGSAKDSCCCLMYTSFNPSYR